MGGSHLRPIMVLFGDLLATRNTPHHTVSKSPWRTLMKTKYAVPTDVIKRLVELGLASDIEDAQVIVEQGNAQELIKEAEKKQQEK